MDSNLTIVCKRCRHSSGVSDTIVHRILPDVDSPSDDSIRKYLLLNKPQLACSNCGAHSCEIEYKPRIGKRTDKPLEACVSESQKRYVDEGIGGVRKTPGNRWLGLKE